MPLMEPLSWHQQSCTLRFSNTSPDLPLFRAYVYFANHPHCMYMLLQQFYVQARAVPMNTYAVHIHHFTLLYGRSLYGQICANST